MADGSISLVRARRFPMVSALAAAISDVAVHTGDLRLDCEHCPCLHHVALAHTWASVGGTSCLGDAHRIWIRGNRCRNRRFAPDRPIHYPTMVRKTGRLKLAALLAILCIRECVGVIIYSYQAVDQYLRPIHSFLQLWLNRNCKEGCS